MNRQKFKKICQLRALFFLTVSYLRQEYQMLKDQFTESLELYATTPECVPLWKIKGKTLTYENLLENVFILSVDLAKFFEIRHSHLTNQNIAKLQKDRHLTNHLPKIRQMIEVGKGAKRWQDVYVLTKHQTEILIMDFSGTKAREKKIAILKRLQAIETDVLHGNYDQARQKASTWDGVQLLSDLGFKPSLPNEMATKKDIATFLKIPESTLATFLAKHTDQIKATKLTKEQIRAIGKKANRLNAYSQDDVFKIAFWMDTEIGKQLKTKIFGDIGVCATPTVKDEVEWKIRLSEVFATLGFKYQHPIGKYTVDFFVEKLSLVLECDSDNHRSYNQKEEQERNEFITQHYALVRFNSKVSWETLVNGILRVKPKEVIKLYLPTANELSKKVEFLT